MEPGRESGASRLTVRRYVNGHVFLGVALERNLHVNRRSAEPDIYTPEKTHAVFWSPIIAMHEAAEHAQAEQLAELAGTTACGPCARVRFHRPAYETSGASPRQNQQINLGLGVTAPSLPLG